MALTPDKKIYTVIDANLNRAKEGIRVIEDITRFYNADKKTSAKLKSIRHSITLTADKLIPNNLLLLKSRNSAKDAGRRIKSKSEFKRKNLSDILFSNFKRIEESLRVLEEFSKLINTKQAAKFKELRYKTYEAEKKIILAD